MSLNSNQNPTKNNAQRKHNDVKKQQKQHNRTTNTTYHQCK